MKEPPQAKPETVYRTGTEHVTITEAHPYHEPVGRIDHQGAGTYRQAWAPECPLCQAENKSVHTAEEA
jgi:hypothetical protein